MQSLSFFSRCWLALTTFFRILGSSSFALQVVGVSRSLPIATARASEEEPSAPTSSPVVPVVNAPAAKPTVQAAAASEPSVESALLMLGLFQRDGRLIDFLEQEVVAFSDADVGAAARVVHAGCRRALHAHFTVQALRTEAEGDKITLESGFDAHAVKLVGDVQGAGPFKGTVKHPGWRATDVRLPTRVGDADPSILAPAEVEV